MNHEEMKDHMWQRHKKGLKVLRIIGMTIGGIFLAVLFGFLFAFVIKMLWNWLMPMLFSVKEITYWQAFGIFLLAKLLFGGFGHSHKNRHDDRWHRKMDEKWHRFMGMGDKACSGTSRKNWKYFHDYWQEEGKKAFEDYIQRQEKKKEEEKE